MNKRQIDIDMAWDDAELSRMAMDLYRNAFPKYLNDGIGQAILKIAQKTNGSNVISFPTRYDWIRAHQIKTLFLITGFQDLIRDTPELTDKDLPPEFYDLRQQLYRYIKMAEKATKEMQCRLNFGGGPRIDGEQTHPTSRGSNHA